MHRFALRRALTALPLMAACIAAFAAEPEWPSQPVRLVVPWAPGGTVDFTGRQLAQKFTELTGKTFFVENRAGGSGTIGSGLVAKAAADGHTALVFDASYATLPALFSKLAWDHADGLAPVATVITTPMAMVVPAASPFKTTAELIDYARKNPGKLNFGSGGVGSTPHIAGEQFKQDAGIDMVHIAYKGGGEALLAVMAGNADVLFTALPTALSQLGSGKVRVLAVTSKERVAGNAAIPTVGETLPGYVFDNWYGIAFPRGTPPAVVQQMHKLLTTAMADPALRQRFVQQGALIRLSTPEEFARLLRDETVRYGQISRTAGIRPE